MSNKTKIPKGWRKLRPNETIRPGDKFHNTVESIGRIGWIESLSISFTPADNLMGAPYIRRLAPRKGRGK